VEEPVVGDEYMEEKPVEEVQGRGEKLKIHIQ